MILSLNKIYFRNGNALVEKMQVNSYETNPIGNDHTRYYFDTDRGHFTDQR